MHSIDLLRNKVSIICFALFVIACNRKEHYDYKLIETKVWKKTDFGYGFYNYLIYQNNQSVIVNIDKNSNELTFNNINTGISKELMIQDISFDMANEIKTDSIFLLNRALSMLYIVNNSGSLINQYTVDVSSDGFYYKIIAQEPEWIGIGDKVVSITCYPSFEGRKKPYHQCYFDLELDIKNNKVKVIPITFPLIYSMNHWWGGLGNNIFKCRIADNKIAYGFPMIDSLYVWDGVKITSRNVRRSKYFNEFPPPVINNDSMAFSRYIIQFQRKTPFYYKLIYDKERKFLYRIVAHSQELKNKNGGNNLNLDRSWSVQLIDEDFKVISEWYFAPDKYNYTSFLITKEGFALMAINNTNQDNVKWDFFKVICNE